METSAQEPYQPVTPPTEPVPIVRRELGSTWPGVIGAIAIVFGALGILNGLMAMASPFFVNMMGNMGGQTTGMVETMKSWMWWVILSGVLTIVVASVLLAAGIGVVRRRAWGAKTMLVWAVLKFVWGGISVAGGVLMQMEQMKAMQAQTASPGQGVPAAMMTGMTDMVMIFGLGFGLLWAWALPVFVLIWFMRPKIRAEVRAW